MGGPPVARRIFGVAPGQLLGHARTVTRQPSQSQAALDRLIAEFGDRLAVGSIITAYARAVRGLQVAGVDAGLIVAAEAMTRSRLAARCSADAAGERRTA